MRERPHREVAQLRARLRGAFAVVETGPALRWVSSARGNEREQLLNAVRDEGISIAAKVFAPAGLDLGAETPGGAGACARLGNPGHLCRSQLPNRCAIARRRSTVGTLFGHNFLSKNVQHRRGSSSCGRFITSGPAEATLEGSAATLSCAARSRPRLEQAAQKLVVVAERLDDAIPGGASGKRQRPWSEIPNGTRGLGTSICCGLQFLIASGREPRSDRAALVAISHSLKRMWSRVSSRKQSGVENRLSRPVTRTRSVCLRFSTDPASPPCWICPDDSGANR